MSSTTYDILRHSVMLRANMLTGSQAGTLQTAYQVTPLTSTQNKSADFAFDHLREAILQAEEDFVQAVAMTGNHPWRSSIQAVTATQASGALLPTTSAGSKPVVGIWGSVIDATDNVELVPAPIDFITRRNRNANTNFICPVYWYAFSGGRILHTAPHSVTLECCIYLRSDQVTVYNAAGNMLLPDPAEPGIVARALSFLFRDGAYVEQAAVWRQYSDDALTVIKAGGTSTLPKTIPMPPLGEGTK